MKTYNTLYRDLESLQLFMQENAIEPHEQWFIRIHTGTHTAESIRPLMKNLKQYLPNTTIIGSSHIAVIYNAEILYDECLISFTQISEGKLHAHLFTTIDRAPKEIAEEVNQSGVVKNAQAAFVFLSNSYHKVSNLIQECNTFSSDVKFIGGVSHANKVMADKEYGFVCLDEEVLDQEGLVICGIEYPHLYTYSNANLGVEQIGQAYTITKTNGTCIEEVDYQDASLWYRNMLHKDSFEKDPEICKVFPFVLPEQEDALRVLRYDVANNQVHWYDDASENTKIRLGYCSPFVVIETCKTICKDLETQPVQTLFAYSCLSRNDIMNKCCSWELTPFANTPISGALCSGEICNINNLNAYGNSTCSILSLSTSEDAHIKIDQEALDSVENLGFDNQHILTYLLKSTSDDMYRTNATLSRQILEQNNQMMEALFIDPGTNLPNLTRYLYDLEHTEYNKLCIISTQNAEMLRSHYGDALCTREIFAKIQRCKEFLNDSDLHFYQHNEDCIMIAALTEYSDERYLQKMKSLFTFLGTVEAKENNFYYVNKFAVVIHENNLLEKAELTLSYIDRTLQRFLVYFPNLGLEDQVEEELQCLAHIKYAILHDGVEPYFQPIYDNNLHKIQKYESLMRLRTKDNEILYPAQFMDVSKKFKLYEELSRLMITKVMHLYQDSEDCVTINLSVPDIESDQTKQLIYDLLGMCKHPENIIFEIVESEEIHQSNVLMDFIANIRDYRAKIAIDDFGAGYSNLLKLVKINADYIKIDGEIIRNMLKDDTCRKILDTILFLSEKMHTELVAEYVETLEIQEQIEHMGIRYSQGYHFSRPKPYHDFYKEIKKVES